MYDRIRHVAVAVRDLRAAEAFYRDLFDATVAFREGHYEDEYGDLPDDVGWDEPGAEITASFLERGGFTLALVRDDDADPSAGTGVIDHLNLGVTAAELDRLRARARDHDCEVAERGPHERVHLRDPYGVTWELAVHAD